MFFRGSHFLIMIGLLGASSLALGQETDSPPAFQPADFNGAVGSFRVMTSAEPTDVQIGQAILFTIRITATQPPRVPPRRPDLQHDRAFTQRFYIEDLPDQDSHSPGSRIWQFVYRLKPRPGAEPSDQVPAFSFVYSKPGLPAESAYQTARSHPIPIQVRAATVAPVARAARSFPDEVYALREGPGVLRHDRPAVLPPFWLILLGLLLPPAACACWYALWRARNPHVRRQKRSRESIAAHRALQLLQSSERRNGHGPVPLLALTAFLQQRLGLTLAEPTPREVAGHLQCAGLSGNLVNRTEAFYRHCDHCRFGPADAIIEDGLRANAIDLILAIEQEQQKGQAS